MELPPTPIIEEPPWTHLNSRKFRQTLGKKYTGERQTHIDCPLSGCSPTSPWTAKGCSTLPIISRGYSIIVFRSKRILFWRGGDCHGTNVVLMVAWLGFLPNKKILSNQNSYLPGKRVGVTNFNPANLVHNIHLFKCLHAPKQSCTSALQGQEPLWEICLEGTLYLWTSFIEKRRDFMPVLSSWTESVCLLVIVKIPLTLKVKRRHNKNSYALWSTYV